MMKPLTGIGVVGSHTNLGRTLGSRIEFVNTTLFSDRDLTSLCVSHLPRHHHPGVGNFMVDISVINDVGQRIIDVEEVASQQNSFYSLWFDNSNQHLHLYFENEEDALMFKMKY